MTELLSSKIERDQAIEQIGALIKKHGIALSEIRAPAIQEEKSTLLTRVLVYVGGILVLSGTGTFLAMRWPEMDSFLRVLLTLGPGIIALTIAVITAQTQKKAPHTITTPLFILGALFETSGLFVFLQEYSSGNDPVIGSLIVFAVMGIQYVAVFSVIRQPSVLLLALLFAHSAFAALFEEMDIDPQHYSFLLSLSGIFISAGLTRTTFSSITGITFFISGLSLACSAFSILNNTPYDIFLIGVAAFLVYLSTLVQSRTLLFVGVASMLGYLGYYTKEYFENIVGWPIALIIIGIILIVSSSYAIRLGRQFKTT